MCATRHSYLSLQHVFATCAKALVKTTLGFFHFLINPTTKRDDYDIAATVKNNDNNAVADGAGQRYEQVPTEIAVWETIRWNWEM